MAKSSSRKSKPAKAAAKKKAKPATKKSPAKPKSAAKPRATKKSAKKSSKKSKKKPAPSAALPFFSDNAPQTALQAAENVFFAALESADWQDHVVGAQQALGISSDCSAAWLLLSDVAGDPFDALEMAEQAVAAAERVLGKKTFEEFEGLFWELDGTRPYMRARAALADRLWEGARRDESIAHVQDLLRLNRRDNQGLRYLLASRLLEHGRDEELEQLFKQYDEPTTFWNFTRAIAAFRRQGDTAESRQLLQTARSSNKHVEAVLLDPGSTIHMLPETYARGTREEAVIYAAQYAVPWRETPGAITWFRQLIAAAGPSMAVGPTAGAKKTLQSKPQAFGVAWQAAISRMSSFVSEKGQLIRPWAALIVEEDSSEVLADEVFTSQPGPEQVFDLIAKRILKPRRGKPTRPSEIQVREDATWEALRPHFEEIGIDLIYRSKLDAADELQKDVDQGMSHGVNYPSLLEAPGLKPDQIPQFYAAAAAYYRAAPWRYVPVDSVIEITCPDLEKRKEPWSGSIMGPMKDSMGLALYGDLETFMDIGLDGIPFRELEDDQFAMSILFAEGFEVSPREVFSCESQGWELAGPEAYPMFRCCDQSQGRTIPKPRELSVLTASLLAIPEFAKKHSPFAAPATETVEVSLGNRRVKVTLSVKPHQWGGCGEDCESCEHHDTCHTEGEGCHDHGNGCC